MTTPSVTTVCLSAAVADLGTFTGPYPIGDVKGQQYDYAEVVCDLGTFPGGVIAVSGDNTITFTNNTGITLPYRTNLVIRLQKAALGVTPIANTVVCLGDSIMSHNLTNLAAQKTYDTYGFWTYINGLLGGRLKLLNNAATPGDTTLGMRNRLAVDVWPYNPEYLFLLGGINDICGSAFPFATTIRNLRYIIMSAIARKITPVYFSILPTQDTAAGVNTAIEKEALYNVVRQMWEFAESTPGMIYIPSHEALTDTATGARTENPVLYQDHIHPGPRANRRIGIVAARILSPLMRQAFAHPYDTQYSSFRCALLNPGMNGVAGTAGGGTTGVVPDLWSTTRSGTPTVACTVAPRNDSRWRDIVPQAREGFFAVQQITPNAVNNRGWLQQTCILLGATTFWISGGSGVLGRRYRPTVANGRHYICTTAGTFSAAGDPTAGWSTQIGTIFTDGTVSLQVVESISAGDTIYAMCEVVCGDWASRGNIELTIEGLDSGSTAIWQVSDSLWDTVRPLDIMPNGYQVLRTPEWIIPTDNLTFSIRLSLKTWGDVPLGGNFTASAASQDLTLAAHGFLPDEKVRLTTTTTLPGGFSTGVDYYVSRLGMTTNTFRLSATAGGIPITAADAGTGTHTIVGQAGGYVAWSNVQIIKK